MSCSFLSKHTNLFAFLSGLVLGHAATRSFQRSTTEPRDTAAVTVEEVDMFTWESSQSFVLAPLMAVCLTNQPHTNMDTTHYQTPT